jgi:uncharacterized protein (TIGR02996 family)
MTDERKFLDAIGAAPKDAAVRLAYADWLEERGDPRAELVRIEEEMLRLPVFSDRFWLLKPRRNELRTGAEPKWLKTMRYGTDCQPVFGHGWPDGCKERWRLIREFTERWHDIPLGDVSGRPDDVREAEARLGRSLPPSVREWVGFYREVQDSPGPRNLFRDVCRAEELEEFSAVSLLLQGEGDYHWAVRHQDLHQPDPPVYGFQLDYESDDSTFMPDDDNPIADSVTAFVIEYLMGYTDGQGGSFRTEVPDARIAELTRDLQAAFPVRARVGASDVFEGENVLVCLSRWRRTTPLDIDVKAARPLPLKAIPDFLWSYASNGGSFSGMFNRYRSSRG